MEVSSIEFAEDKGNKSLHIYLSYKKGSKFTTEDVSYSSVYDSQARQWQHVNFFEHRCYLPAKVPRIKQKDGKVKTYQVPWARVGSGFTLMFEAYSMLLIESEMPVSKASKIMGVYSQRLWTVFNYWVSKSHKEDDIGEVKKAGYDETSSKKGHKYVTTLLDIENRRVLFATEGKGSEAIEESVEYLKTKSIPIEQIDQVCIDMSPAFISGCSTYLPEASITFDKFHVVKQVNKAIDELRKSERKSNEQLKGHKYTFLKSRLSPEIKKERDLLLEYYPKLGQGYRLVELFKDFWELTDKQEAEGYLAFWCDLARDSRIGPFIKVANMIKSHWTGIINYIDSRITNGILEGINSKIQLAKKRARGYRNINNFINMIYFICGKLKFDYPIYSI